jgi:hypothetical protein
MFPRSPAQAAWQQRWRHTPGVAGSKADLDSDLDLDLDSDSDLIARREAVSIGKGGAAWSSGAAADSASAQVNPMEEALTARTERGFSTDTHPAP